MAELPTNNQNIHSSFQRVYDGHLSGKETYDYLDRITRLFSLLIEIDKRNKGIKKEVTISEIKKV